MPLPTPSCSISFTTLTAGQVLAHFLASVMSPSTKPTACFRRKRSRTTQRPHRGGLATRDLTWPHARTRGLPPSTWPQMPPLWPHMPLLPNRFKSPPQLPSAQGEISVITPKPRVLRVLPSSTVARQPLHSHLGLTDTPARWTAWRMWRVRVRRMVCKQMYLVTPNKVTYQNADGLEPHPNHSRDLIF